MLLSLMRKHAKSYLIKVLIAIIAIVFVFYFGYSFRSEKGAKVAIVNGELISGVEYRKAYRDMVNALQRQYGNLWSENLIEVFDLKNQALQQLIDEKLLSHEAQRVGLGVTEDEIQAEIMSYPAFQFQGRFDERRYRAVLNQNRMAPEDFENTVRHVLLKDKISQLLTAFLPATEQELREYYTFQNREAKIQFVTFSPEAYKDSITFAPPQVETYFEEHQEDYRIPDQIRARYIEIGPEEFLDQTDVSSEEIRAYYEENLERYRMDKEIKARHILFKVAENADEQAVKAVENKAKDVLEKARKGEDFEELARTYSEGPSREKGGDLGFFSSGQMVGPFEEVAFQMKAEEISDLVRTQFGFHIIKVEEVREARTKPLEEIRDEIEQTLRSLTAVDLAHEKALTLMDQMPYEVNLETYAKEHGVTSHQTDYFSRKEDIPRIVGNDKLREVIFSLDPGTVSDVLEYENRFYLFQVADKKPAHLPELEDVAERVQEDLTLHLAREKARSEAEDLLKRLRQGGNWEDLVRETELTPETSDFFKRGESIEGIGRAPELQEAVFGLHEKEPYPDQVFESDSGYHITRWEATRGIDEEAFQEEKPEVRRAVRDMKHRILFDAWMEDLRENAEVERLMPL